MRKGSTLRHFVLAVGFFTRVPMPSFTDFEDSELNQAAQYFPLVGALVGVAGAMVFVVAHSLFGQPIAVLLSMASTVMLTGGFHEDGLADSADGLGAWERERRLAIMQDSRLGTYGALALLFALWIKFQTLSTLPSSVVPLCLVGAHAFSRLMAVYLMVSLNYAKLEGKAKPLATQVSPKQALIASFWGILPGILALVIWPLKSNAAQAMGAVWVLLSMVGLWLWWRHHLRNTLGGYTGDTLGAVQQVAEVLLYLGVLAYLT